MARTVLYDESPIIGILFTTAPIIAYELGYVIVAIILLVILVFLLFFYRDFPINRKYPLNAIISPADGTITDIISTKNSTIISIFLSPLNIHTQVYPITGTVILTQYDNTGKFDIVVKRDKCRENEKVIQYIQSNYNNTIVTVTQIAGFLPRRISTGSFQGKKVKAGEYLGIIKFGSRVDLEIPREVNISLKVGDRVYPGDIISYL